MDAFDPGILSDIQDFSFKKLQTNFQLAHKFLKNKNKKNIFDLWM